MKTLASYAFSSTDLRNRVAELKSRARMLALAA